MHKVICNSTLKIKNENDHFRKTIPYAHVVWSKKLNKISPNNRSQILTIVTHYAHLHRMDDTHTSGQFNYNDDMIFWTIESSQSITSLLLASHEDPWITFKLLHLSSSDDIKLRKPNKKSLSVFDKKGSFLTS